MTPRQLHALEWAVRRCENLRYGFSGKAGMTEFEFYTKTRDAQKALAAAWAEYRAGQVAARMKPPRRALQRVPLGRGVDGGNAKG